MLGTFTTTMQMEVITMVKRYPNDSATIGEIQLRESDTGKPNVHTMLPSSQPPAGTKTYCAGSGIHDGVPCDIGFPHYRIMILGSPARQAAGRKPYRPATPGRVFNVCALCDHWLGREVVRCECPAACHAEARGETVA
jgi:hypothetical protein